MPSDTCREVIAYLKKHKTNRSFGDLSAILEQFGFKMHDRSKGSHRVFSKPGCELNVSITEGHGEVLPAYVRKVIRALEECCDE